MSPTEIGRLLTFAAALDPRLSNIDDHARDARLLAWTLVLADVPITYDQACAAVAQHYQTSRETLMPADVVSRAPRTPTPLHPPSQDPPCDHCGLQPTHARHTEHPYQPADTPQAITTGPPTINWHTELHR